MVFGVVVGVMLASLWCLCRVQDRQDERLEQVLFLEQCLSLPAAERSPEAVDQ